MEWFGGKPAGWIHLKNNCFQAIVLINGHQITKCFSHIEYNSVDNAFELAKEWQYKISTENELTKNMIRIVEPPDAEPFLEVKLQNGKIMKCDCDHINLVEDSIWTAWKSSSNNNWYARRKSGQEYALFQSLVYPNYSKICHANDDTLDNRSSNLCYGKKMSFNNVTGVKGIYYLSGNKPSWYAQIGTGKSKKRKAFSIKKYGDNAKEKAIEQRQKWVSELYHNNDNP